MPKAHAIQSVASLPSEPGRMANTARLNQDLGYGNVTSERRGEETDALLLIGGGERRIAPQTGAKALLLAVLEDALRCYFSNVPRIRSDAEMWIDSRARTPFSFEVICDLYGIDSEAARAALRQLRRTEERPQMLRQRHRGTVRRTMLAAARG